MSAPLGCVVIYFGELTHWNQARQSLEGMACNARPAAWFPDADTADFYIRKSCERSINPGLRRKCYNVIPLQEVAL